MFFSGDPTARKRVDLGGRSSKERDRQKLVEESRLERKRRSWIRQQNSAALKIQKCYRGRKAAARARSWIREQFYRTYGSHCENVHRSCLHPDSDFLRMLFFYINTKNADDFSILVVVCRKIQEMIHDSGDALTLFMVMDYPNKQSLVLYRMKQLAVTCIQAVYLNREQLKDQLMEPRRSYKMKASLLLETVVILLDSQQILACKIASSLLNKNIYTLLRGISLAAMETANCCRTTAERTSLEHILCLLISHNSQYPCTCSDVDPGWTFLSQMLTICSLWNFFPNLKEAFVTKGFGQHYFRRIAQSARTKMTICLEDNVVVLPVDVSLEHLSFSNLVVNVLEAAASILLLPNCSFDMVVDLAVVTTSLLEVLSSWRSSADNVKGGSMVDEDKMDEEYDETEAGVFQDLERQVIKALNGRFVLQLVKGLLGGTIPVSDSTCLLEDRDVMVVGTICAFLHEAFTILPLEKTMTILAYRTDLVPVLWNYIKHYNGIKNWPSFSELPYLPAETPGWLLPLSVFCPLYKHMLTLVDNEEFFEQEKPLPLNDIRYLIIVLRQVLWQLLWATSTFQTTAGKSGTKKKGNYVEHLKLRVNTLTSDLLSQLQDWNNRRQFTSPADFHADGVDDAFISLAIVVGTKANDISKRAPFLIPFTSRVKIFNSQLQSARQRTGDHGAFTRNRFRIRRDHILEDAYDQMSALSEDDLKGLIRVTFINEFGVEEAGIDGGGIFKDFMENIIRAAFDVQYGLFKETSDHLLFPNPGSGMIHEQHLQYFHFLGTLLAKAMYEGILVDIPFATFFLSKLKQKFNYLNDLPSLDPELYRHLISLKHYEGDISELELYFVIVNNEYGEQREEELILGGKNIRVTHENVIQYIHFVSNHRLNLQIRQQSSHFLRGFQQLIQKEWINMFDEHELQLLISGSLDCLDIDDLRQHTNYAGGYETNHDVVGIFWEVLKSFSTTDQKKFLKFVTGCSRGPLLGFSYLEPWFCIQKASGSASDESLDRLPTSATCMNLLKLPPYKSKEQLETKLLYAINSDAGFDLS